MNLYQFNCFIMKMMRKNIQNGQILILFGIKVGEVCINA